LSGEVVLTAELENLVHNYSSTIKAKHDGPKDRFSHRCAKLVRKKTQLLCGFAGLEFLGDPQATARLAEMGVCGA
jgi:hypothetical protein